MVHLGYSDEKGLLSRQRKNTRLDAVSRFFYNVGDLPSDDFAPGTGFGDPEFYDVSAEGFFSGFAPQGRFFAGNSQFTFGPTGQLQPCFTNNALTCGGGAGQGPNGFNRQFFRTLAVPVERYLFAARGHYEVFDNVSAIMEATYNKTTSAREIEPFALDSADIFPATGGAFPIETLVDGVLVVNPLIPQVIADAAVDEDGDGLRDISFTRRLVEVGSRTGETSRDFYRFVAGLEGKILDDRFSWDISYNFGRTTESQTSNGQVNVLNFANALQAIPGPNGTLVCADPNAVAQGCVPINVFGTGSITPQALAYINAQQTFQTDIQQQVFAGNVSGSLFELPAGPLGVAVGAEYRREESSEDNDALTNAGLNGGNALPDTSGRFNVKEAYGEVNVPIFRDQPFAQQLNLRAAGRISDYSTVGTTKTYSLGADYAPLDAVRFRGTYAKAVRAPNIGELFTGPSQTFPTGLQDPCEGISANDTGTLAQQCLSDPGVVANIALNGVFTINQADQQGISGFNSGNPNLDVETAKSFTAGVVINPRTIPALRNLVLSVDYYNIKVDDAITFPSRTTILDQCFNEGNEVFCQFIFRRPTASGANSPGSLEFINSGAVNSAVSRRGASTPCCNTARPRQFMAA
jgi:outer membrane receptor protein involved in Fe transport